MSATELPSEYAVSPLTDELRLALSEFWHGDLNWDVDMARYSTFRSGGKAAALIDVRNNDELRRLLQWLSDNGVLWRIIGGGSNILVSQSGFSGVIIRLRGEFRDLSMFPAGAPKDRSVRNFSIVAGAGCSLAKLSAWCREHALTGLEFLTGIPGSVGGAVRMNAGAWGKSIGDLIESVTFSDRFGISHQVKASGIHFTYRNMTLDSDWSENALITDACFRVSRGDRDRIDALCHEISRKRREKQPVEFPSAGSFFKNPEGDSAGRLIEAAGLKGMRIGNAKVSEKHANFIVNTGAANADDIAQLMQEVQRKVYQYSGIMLEPEVHFL